MYRYYTTLSMMFVCLLLTANVIGDKPLLLGPVILPAGLLIFPMTYLLGDALTEVYGFKHSRRVIWMGLFCSLFMALACRISIHLPTLDTWLKQEAYAEILGSSSRLMLISVFTYCVGEYTNAYLVTTLKARLQGRLFWLRALCGSWIGEGIETMIFMSLAFWGTMPDDQLLRLAGCYYAFKMIYALCAMPLLNAFVIWLKKQESMIVQDDLAVKPTLQQASF